MGVHEKNYYVIILVQMIEVNYNHHHKADKSHDIPRVGLIILFPLQSAR